MPLMVMSNPGLHLALLGNPRRKRRGHRRSARSKTTITTILSNPGKSAMSIVTPYFNALKPQTALNTAMSPFKGANKVKNIGLAAGGAVGSYMLAGTVAGLAKKGLTAVGAGTVANGAVASRLLGFLANFTVGYAASKFIKGDTGKALFAGAIVAGLVEAAVPGKMDALVAMIPFGVGAKVQAVKAGVSGLAGGMFGLDGYVDAPSYQGVGTYVDAPGYQGVGAYVDAPGYQGVGFLPDMGNADNMLAGNNDSNTLAGPDDSALAGLGFYLDDAAKYQDTYLQG